jgi:hypothetical protein
MWVSPPNQKFLIYLAGPRRRGLRSFSSEYSGYSVVEAPCQRCRSLPEISKVVDSAEALFHVDDFQNFVHVQSESAVRSLATGYP